MCEQRKADIIREINEIGKLLRALPRDVDNRFTITRPTLLHVLAQLNHLRGMVAATDAAWQEQL